MIAGVQSVLDDMVSFVLGNGLTRARLVMAGELVVEERFVTEGCGGCPGYGKNLYCPPYIPSPADKSTVNNNKNNEVVLHFRSNGKVPSW